MHKITPHSSELNDAAFAERVGPKFAADRAASSAACYPGGRQGRPSYRQVFEEVWIQQKWPSLCRALAGSRTSMKLGEFRRRDPILNEIAAAMSQVFLRRAGAGRMP